MISVPKLIKLPEHVNSTGKISVIEKKLPFEIKRVYWIYDITDNRGGHAHKKNQQALIVIKGSCQVLIRNKSFEEIFTLNSCNQMLLLEPEDWHLIKNISKETIILVLASKEYDKKDYIDQIIL